MNLDALVVTHRHNDHSWYGTQRGRETNGPPKPVLVVRPWTDAPAPPIDGDGSG